MKRRMILLMLAVCFTISIGGCKKQSQEEDTEKATVVNMEETENAEGEDNLQTERTSTESVEETESIEILSTEEEYEVTESEVESEDLRGVIVGS